MRRVDDCGNLDVLAGGGRLQARREQGYAARQVWINEQDQPQGASTHEETPFRSRLASSPPRPDRRPRRASRAQLPPRTEPARHLARNRSGTPLRPRSAGRRSLFPRAPRLRASGLPRSPAPAPPGRMRPSARGVISTSPSTAKRFAREASSTSPPASSIRGRQPSDSLDSIDASPARSAHLGAPGMTADDEGEQGDRPLPGGTRPRDRPLP